jgi:hypothetical protein
MYVWEARDPRQHSRFGVTTALFDCFSELSGNIGKEKARDHYFSASEGDVQNILPLHNNECINFLNAEKRRYRSCHPKH